MKDWIILVVAFLVFCAVSGAVNNFLEQKERIKAQENEIKKQNEEIKKQALNKKELENYKEQAVKIQKDLKNKYDLVAGESEIKEIENALNVFFSSKP